MSSDHSPPSQPATGSPTDLSQDMDALCIPPKGSQWMTFSHLPAEMILKIAEFLLEPELEGDDPEEIIYYFQRDINTLARLNSFTYEHVNPFLYTTNIELGGSKALYWGAACDIRRTVEMMIEFGADIHAVENISSERYLVNVPSASIDETSISSQIQLFDARGNPLHVAIAWGRKEMAKFLLDQGIDPNQVTKGIYTNCGHYASPMDLAIRAEYLDVVIYLIDKGADVNRQNELKHTPLQHVFKKSTWRLNWPDDQKYFINVLLGSGADPSLTILQKETPIQLAFENVDKSLVQEVLKMLIEAGADVNATLSTSWDWKTIHWASLLGYTEIVRLLLDRGVDINIRDGRRLTPLFYAIDMTHFGVPQHLMEVRDITWRWEGNVETVNLLMERGADMNVSAWNGRLRLQYIACRNWDPHFRAAFADSPLLANFTAEEQQIFNRPIMEGRTKPVLMGKDDSDSD